MDSVALRRRNGTRDAFDEVQNVSQALLLSRSLPLLLCCSVALLLCGSLALWLSYSQALWLSCDFTLLLSCTLALSLFCSLALLLSCSLALALLLEGRNSKVDVRRSKPEAGLLVSKCFILKHLGSLSPPSALKQSIWEA